MDSILPRAHSWRSGNTLVILNAPGSAYASGSSAPNRFDPDTTGHAHSMPPIFIALYVPWTYCLCALTESESDKCHAMS